MPRNKYKKPGAANLKLERAIRNARRATRNARRAQQPVATERLVKERGLDEHLAALDLNTESQAQTFKEERMATATIRQDRMEKGRVPVEEHFQQELIKADPDMANYKMVYMVDPSSRILLLRFPGRPANQPYCARDGCKPLELRIKPKHGHVEIDIPVDIHSPNWDTVKAIKYQQAMRKSSTLQQGKSYDMAGGFGVNDEAAPAKKSKESKESRDDTTVNEPSMETLLSNIDDANNKGHVMNKITLGGRIQPHDPNQPRLMAGTFKGNVCYMSHVDAVVELSANFQHLDALADLEKTSARHQRNTEKGKETEKEREEAQAKAVDLTVKSSEPDEGMPEGARSSIKEQLEDMADEPWQRLKWIDQDDPESYRRFDEHFGIGKDVDSLPNLVSTMTPEQWLDHISIPRYDHTTKSYREMTFPRKNKFSAGTARGTGHIDHNGAEWFDPSDPRDHENWIYSDINPEEFESGSDDAGDDEESDEESDDEIPEGYYYETESEEEGLQGRSSIGS
ncbi:MAG: hypothetical protein Q9196_001630 [Gyalolechia fulgens]